MAITKVFKSGNSQAVRIPRRYRFRSSRVEITKRGNEVILREKPETLAPVVDILKGFSDDFFKGGRRQPKQDKRESF